MSDDKPKLGIDDSERIDVNVDTDLRTWAKKFDSTVAQIKDAVEAVGDCAADVEMHLKGTHATSNADRELRAGAAGTSA